jgi:hypothetical protein
MSLPDGRFVPRDGELWYRIDGYDRMDPFFVALAGDGDHWAFVSTNGSLAAGRGDKDRSYFPYETVDKIHRRWEHTGPRTWVRWTDDGQTVLWEPFARRPGHPAGARSLEKNALGTRLAFEEVHPSGNLVFRQEWSLSPLGLVRTAALTVQRGGPYEVLDGLVGLVPAGLLAATYQDTSVLAEAYHWSEAALGGRAGLYTLYSQITDKAEPHEVLTANLVWGTHPHGATVLLSDRQVEAFAGAAGPASASLVAEGLVRGRRAAYLAGFTVEPGAQRLVWHQVVDGPLSQARVADRLERWATAGPSGPDIEAALDANDAGIAELMARADGFQKSARPLAAVHHGANVLFNIQRGGVFPRGTRWDADDLVAFARGRNRLLAGEVAALVRGAPVVERAEVLDAARRSGPQVERLVREYLPLTFSRRHGDPSRPWNQFQIRVRNGNQRVCDYQGNWRDIFQNWEALVWSDPGYVGSMVATFLSAMTLDGHNPYRISRAGVDWEVPEANNPWSHIGYWGDHQVVYLQKLLEAAESLEPGLLADLWERPAFTSADVPYVIRPYAAVAADPKHTIDFDAAADARARHRAQDLGGDGMLVPGPGGLPDLATLGEKLAALVVAKAGTLVPGGGLWLMTQRPEWNDANNALAGHGLSVVTLGALVRMARFLVDRPWVEPGFSVDAPTAVAVEVLTGWMEKAPGAPTLDPGARRDWVDGVGSAVEGWRRSRRGAFALGSPRTTLAPGAFRRFLEAVLAAAEATLAAQTRPDGLVHSYNLLTLAEGRAEVHFLYPMLEGQVSFLATGTLSPARALALGRALEASPLYDPARKTYLLYPDRALPGFLARNVLDDEARGTPEVRQLLADGGRGLVEAQADGTVRFAPSLVNRRTVEAAAASLGPGAQALGATYERVLGHREFTGRSGTMFGYEGLGCVYWHMVAKLLLAVQEAVFRASDTGAPETAELAAWYRRIRSGLGYHKTPGDYGAFPFDPYSHTPAQGGAQQPGMTGQVKEEILTRWGELGLRWVGGRLMFDPVLFDLDEIPSGGSLAFTYRRVPFSVRRGPHASVSYLRCGSWTPLAPLGDLDLDGAEAVDIVVG